MSNVLPLIDFVGYLRGFLLFRDLAAFSSYGGPVTLVRLVSRPRFGLSLVAVLPRVVVWFAEGFAAVRLPIP